MTAGYGVHRPRAPEYSGQPVTKIHVSARQSDCFGALRGRAGGDGFVL